MDIEDNRLPVYEGDVEVFGEYIEPDCDVNVKPYVGQKILTEQDANSFYVKYAAFCGFDVRNGTTTMSNDDKIIVWRYFLCNREGKKTIVSTDSINNNDSGIAKRRRVTSRCNCQARLVIRYAGPDGYVVTKWINRHTHMFVNESSKQFLKINRNMDYMHKKFFLDCHRASIGPMKSFKLMKEVMGGYSNVGCSSLEFKNFGRDMRAYVAGADAQMVLSKMHDQRERCSGFFFDYAVDSGEHLKCIFWADPIARRNYQAFGDVVSFDATYDTNKYGMRFLPFTGKDNHGKIISFGASLIAREDVDSYTWVLEKFKACMQVVPHMILTDQDPAVKIAIERVLRATRHRLCMWHIMKKAPGKVSKLLENNDDFLKRYNAIVWCDFIKPDVFEERWNILMMEYGLGGDDWFKNMYEIRELWIPAYFLDFHMGGLIKTTSISESVNSFFGKYARHYANLVEFFMHFDNAIETQRHSNARLNELDSSTVHDLQTNLAFEKHALTIYTNSIFKDVQKEIVDACFNCRMLNMSCEGEIHICRVASGGGEVFDVAYNEVEKTFSCGCSMFDRVGLLCCHIFFVFKNYGLESIPEKYVTSRWCKNAYFNPIHVDSGHVAQEPVLIDERKLKLNRIYGKFYEVLAMIEDASICTVDSVLEGLTVMARNIQSGDETLTDKSSNEVVLDRFYGGKVPKEVRVLPPREVKAKGSGSRIKSRKEKAIERAAKPMRMCSKCHKKGHHDARNCKAMLDVDDNVS